MWCRLKKLPQDRLTVGVHQWSLAMSRRNIKTLEYHVRSILKDAKLYEKVSDENFHTKYIINELRKHLNLKDKQNWLDKLWDDSGNEINGNKLRLYREFKKDIFTETYVTSPMSFAHKKHLAMLRCGSLPLEIELGRRTNVPLEERICKLCNNENIENEVHVLLECPLYDDIRHPLLEYLHDTDLTVLQKYYLILSKPELQALIGKCIFRIMERRDIFRNVFNRT